MTGLSRAALTTNTLSLLQYGNDCPVCHAHGRKRHCCPSCKARCLLSAEAVLLSVLAGMANKGWTEEDAWLDLLDQGNRGGRFLQTMHMRNKTRARSWLARQYAHAVDFVTRNPFGDGAHNCYELVQYEQRTRMGAGYSQGAAGVTERAVLRVLVDKALVRMHPLVRMSLRAVSVEADVSLPAVSAALARLTKLRWIELYKAATAEQASTYRLLTRDRSCTGDSVPYGGEGTPVQVMSPPLHQVFGPKGVGRGAAETYQLLPVERRPLPHGYLARRNRCIPLQYKGPANVQASVMECRKALSDDGLSVADLTALHPGSLTAKTVRRRLNDLLRVGLAYVDSQGRWWRYASDLDGLAEYLQIPDTRWEKKARYERERHNYWDYLISEEGRGKRPSDLVRVIDGSDFVYGYVDREGCLHELGRRCMTPAEVREVSEGECDADIGTAGPAAL